MSGHFSDRVKALRLPLDGCIVIGSGIMGELGIRESDDIDLILTEPLFESLVDRDGWYRIEKHGRPVFLHDDHKAEAWLSWVAPHDTGLVDFATLLPDTVLVNDVRFVSLPYSRSWKEWYGRDKDRADVALIDAYMESRV